MKATKRFYWFGVLDANSGYCRRYSHKWPKWQHLAYSQGYYETQAAALGAMRKEMIRSAKPA